MIPSFGREVRSLEFRVFEEYFYAKSKTTPFKIADATAACT